MNHYTRCFVLALAAFIKRYPAVYHEQGFLSVTTRSPNGANSSNSADKVRHSLNVFIGAKYKFECIKVDCNDVQGSGKE